MGSSDKHQCKLAPTDKNIPVDIIVRRVRE